MSASFSFLISKRQMLSFAAVAISLATAACNKSGPSGQTVATVNGESITQSELNYELGLTGADASNWKTLQPKALQALIDRKLVVQAGERDGVDKKPAAVLALERSKDIAVVNLALQAVTARLNQPITASDVESYLTKHPEMAKERRTLLVEQIRFPASNDKKLIAALTPAKTLSDLTAILTNQGISYQRATLEIDSASLDRGALNRLMGTTNGEPFLIIEGPTAIANHVISVRPAEASSAAVIDLAKQGIVRDRIQEGIVQHQAALRKAAKIEYAKPVNSK
jgi:EpsD family peptidyl-prolyl cis-trans isomerase